jgi:hypothetical protein
MVKKKKKLSPFEQQKQMQLQRTQFRNIFMQKLRDLCAYMGDPTLFHLIPESELNRLFRTRTAPLKIRVTKGAKIQKRLVEVMESSIKKSLNLATIELMPGGERSISLTDYIMVANTLEFVLTTDTCKVEQKERFGEFLRHADMRYDAYHSTVCSVCESVCDLYNNIAQHKSLYAFNFDMEANCNNNDYKAETTIMSKLYASKSGRVKGERMFDGVDLRVHPVVTIYTLPLDVKPVRLNNETRPAVQIGTVVYQKNWYDPEVSTLQFPLHELTHPRNPDDVYKLEPEPAPHFVPVYIQQHAINRLLERTGCLVPSYAMLNACLSLETPLITRMPAGSFLVDYSIDHLKVGYLLCDLIDDSFVLVRTFLFITQFGTPEGDKLGAMTKLQKEDVKYLAIDNLRSLLSSDIADSEATCNLFRDIGCQSILDLCRKAKDSDYLKDLLGIQQQKTSLSELITEYLAPHADNDEYIIGE